MLFDHSRKIAKRSYPLIIAASLAALTACTSMSGSSSSSGATSAMSLTMPGPKGPLETHAITIEAVPTADAAGLYIANDLGYFAREGLTVHIVPSGGGELQLTDLKDGKTDLAEGNYVSYIQAQVDGDENLRIIANGSQMQPGNQALYVMPGSRITSVATMAKYHARIGVNTAKNIGSLLIGALMEDNGFSASSVKPIVASPLPNPFVNILAMLAQHQIDVAWLPEPFGTLAQQQGAVKIADFDSGSLLNFPIGAYLGTAAWIQAHPNTVAAFLHALQEGQQVADTNRAQVEKSLVSNTLVPNKTPLAAARQIAALMTINAYPLTMDVPEMQRVSNSMFQFGLEQGLTQPYNILRMIQPEPGMITMGASG
jgi:NitT/TauT family transport system substrate-binding protein